MRYCPARCPLLSSDGTAEIIREYVARYPDLITAVFQTTNQYSRGNAIGQFMSPLVRGNYFAVCEGDDSWRDPRKLQIQVEFLESQPDYVISGHDAFILDEQGHCVAESKLPDGLKKHLSADDLKMGRAWILTLSWIYRNLLPGTPVLEQTKVKNVDAFKVSLLGQYGGSKYHHDIQPACYRMHRGGV